MTLYEIARMAAEPGLPYLHAKVRHELRTLTNHGSRILDVGGRRSPYTVGLPAKITIFDLPRESSVQEQLELGINESVLATIRRRRSNVEDVILGDMTSCTLPSESFDGVVAVEVIEHVVDDDAFLSNAARVVRPGGWVLLTTPNGDYIPNTNPDHVRHYRRSELAERLQRHFSEVRVVYGVATGRTLRWGLRSISPRRPIRALQTVLGNLGNRRASRGVEERAQKTAHLFALARKRD